MLLSIIYVQNILDSIIRINEVTQGFILYNNNTKLIEESVKNR